MTISLVLIVMPSSKDAHQVKTDGMKKD